MVAECKTALRAQRGAGRFSSAQAAAGRPGTWYSPLQRRRRRRRLRGAGPSSGGLVPAPRSQSASQSLRPAGNHPGGLNISKQFSFLPDFFKFPTLFTHTFEIPGSGVLKLTSGGVLRFLTRSVGHYTGLHVKREYEAGLHLLLGVEPVQFLLGRDRAIAAYGENCALS